MHRFTLTFIGLFLLSGACHAQKDPTKKVEDGKAIQGTWKMDKGWRKGKAVDPASRQAQTLWVISKDRIVLKDPTRAREEIALFKLDPKKKPAEITLRPEPDKNNKDLVQGIYEIKGDTLKICFTQEKNVRPAKFEAPEGTRITYVILKRVKK